jgi:hypothetical protein
LSSNLKEKYEPGIKQLKEKEKALNFVSKPAKKILEEKVLSKSFIQHQRKNMKLLSTFLISILSSFTLYAQQNRSAVNLEIDGNKSLQLSIDGKSATLTGALTNGTKTTLLLNTLETGQHTLQITRTRTEVFSGVKEIIPVLFNLRYGYDMLIKVNENGSLELVETKKVMAVEYPPMGNTEFNTLLKNVRNQATVTGKRSLIANAFNNTNNYFTTFQVEQLLQLVNSETYRLQLAKLSYRAITDPDNFDQLYDLFNNQSSKTELEEYVNSYKDTNSRIVPMSDADFNSLYQEIRNQRYSSAQMTSLTNTFNNNNYHFTSYQAKQLIQLIFSENNRLQLAKLSYRTITDTGNFGQVAELLTSQTSKNELTAYINSYNNSNPVSTKPQMSDAVFNVLYQDIKRLSSQNLQMASLTNVFNDTSNYYSTAQAIKFIQIVTTEPNRLQLAKLSYRGIIDTVNFPQVYILLPSQAAKDELRTYIENYNNPPKIPMTDANFNALYQTVQLQFFPGERMTSLNNAFNNAANNFTSAQVRKLVLLVSQETNRLQLAKLSYRSVTDRNNFSILYDLFTQANRNDLDAYVKAYKD